MLENLYTLLIFSPKIEQEQNKISVGINLYSQLGSRDVRLILVKIDPNFISALIIMTQIIDPIRDHENESIMCFYVNATSQIQVVRISNISNWYFERVVFPGQRLVFEAFPQALLEIHTGMMASAILSDTIPCQRLCVNEDNYLHDGGDNSSEVFSDNYQKNRDEEESRQPALASVF